MCGVTGWVSYDRELTAHTVTLRAMTATLAARGPDGEGVWTARHAGLGHRRLAVIDLPGGAQPMVAETPAGAIALSYSGEVYNHRELRAELQRRGHRFRTASDTEVVLTAYLEWGEDLVEHLNGMYAFAVWDDRTERLLLVRDRLGVKPMFIYPTADGLLFGSEPKAILANPLARKALGEDGLREIFGFVKMPGSAIWHGMRELKPGTLAVLDHNGLRERVYWRVEAMPHPDNAAESVEHVRELLHDIMRRQLVADVPQCVLLSGGLDSSVLTALAAEVLHERGEIPRTFAVSFAGEQDGFVPHVLQDSLDAPFVRQVARHVGTEHTDIVLDHTALADPDNRAAAVTARDLPTGMGEMDVSLLLLFQAARARSTVALSGESADEVFAGYWWQHDPAAQQAPIYPWIAGIGGAQSQTRPMINAGLAARMDIPGHLVGGYADALAQAPVLDTDDPREQRLRRICHVHLSQFLTNMLDRKDRMSMAVGLEVRVPFCDHRLVEYVYNAPWALKTFDGKEKSLLRGAARGLLPSTVLERRKSPYPSTQDVKYLLAVQDQLHELLSRRDATVFEIIERDWVRAVATTDPALIDRATRAFLERLLDITMWLDIYRPEMRL
ncbi:asparagine synthase (glutamine-hydrolyzing) [Crossiella cryophila]|uniref:asparagine synthase (glutamine-hydrolyzing) n=1 Tax=Crossiella cryophila TaxID=43355 RepID=A0A7W7FYW5_9PSEU|nr:asparagine synthase (glutamine-hydrolyzing) [Crossiella cryophila]MBB4682103.1 asparagine synthase (glutamine-hydrolyzing) [Crossiella cryophila]